MSRIFEALQRSEPETATFEFPQVIADLKASLGEFPETAEFGTGLPPQAEAEPEATPEAPPADLSRFRTLNLTVPQQGRIVTLTDKESLGAEKFRFLGVRLRQLQQSRQLKKLLITSTVPEEGKSMISANLAVTLARKKNQKVLLIDGDLRRPVLAPRFGASTLAGLSEWLQEAPRPIENIYRLEPAGFWFLPAGRTPEHPLELMQSGRLSTLLDHLAHWFDWIVIDSPPILPLADTTLWTRLADGMLLVAREGVTEKRQLQRGLQVLDQSKLLGVVLNGSTNTDSTNYYQRYGPTSSPSQDPKEENV
ncbi:MAG: CpsD/CapB family tyrosine-protein kinase [Acidobacteria bacterium]|jgi:capsular exopolysaccharide synthesis family protein|nr:CpsD/CapB family tyrosine-protein kinase [Acidobacteriota bacterium]